MKRIENNGGGRIVTGTEERATLYLSQKGIWYRLRKKIAPRQYRERKLFAGLIGAFIGAFIGLNLSLGGLFLAVMISALLGYMAPDFYYLAENREDNRRILADMHMVYDTLRVYLAIDVFITDALEECYLQVRNRRLKTAIYELKEGLKSQSEQEREIESFRQKFDNPQINQLANLLSQYYRSGNVHAIMEDLSEQMVAIDHAMNLRLKEKLEWKSLIKEVLVLIGMLGGIAVALIGSISAMLGDIF